MTKTIKGFKVFKPDWTSNDVQFKVGETYKYDGEIDIYSGGFRFYIEAVDCFNPYNFKSQNKVAEVEALGLVETRGKKMVTNKIKIVRELEWSEVLKLVNVGKENTGFGNIGHMNSGHWNIGNENPGDNNTGDKNFGDWNSGSRNLGDWNSGDKNLGSWNSGFGNSGESNSGYWNTGNKNSGIKNLGSRNSGDGNFGNLNSGDWNFGNKNSGNWNTGDWNSGDWNSGNGNSGVFCTQEPKIKIFDVQSDMTLSEWRQTEAAKILAENFEQNVWTHSFDMTEEEKEEHPKYKVTGGYLKALSFKEACNNMWQKLTEREKEVIKNIPNFNEEKFKEITGIEV